MKIPSFFKRRIYLDHAAGTPVPAGIAGVFERMRDIFGNPSAFHAEGRAAKETLDRARARLARALGVKPADIIVTGSGTEANNLAILGIAHFLARAGVSYSDMHFVTLATEHPSVLECMRELERRGARVSYCSVDAHGLAAPEKIADLCGENTVLVSVAQVNSEIGVIQDVAGIARALRARGLISAFAHLEGWKGPYLHADASQSPLYIECAPARLGADLVTIDAQKIGGPKGIGALVFGKFVPLSPVIFGGSQERRLRPGTENVAGLAAFAEAFAHAVKNRAAARVRIAALRDQFLARIRELIPDVTVNGSLSNRIANNINVSFPGIDAEYLAVLLDERGVACATKSACLGAEGDGSYVVSALGGAADRPTSSLRFTLGPQTTAADIAQASRILAEAHRVMRTHSTPLSARA